jgi:hypothetical protein
MTTRLVTQGRRIGIGLLFLVSAHTALAHHSFGMFDMKKEVTLKGVVKSFQWTNPHMWIDIVAKDSSNKDVVYSIEGGSLNAARQSGWTRDSLKPGDQVTLVVHPLRDGSSPGGSLVSVIVNGVPLGKADKAEQ